MCGNVAARSVDELRQKGKKEERGLGIENVDKDSLREDAGKAVRRRNGVKGRTFGREEGSNAKKNQIEGARELNDVKGASRGGKDRGKAKGCGRGVNQSADGDSRSGDDARFAALTDRAAKDVKHGRAGDEEQDKCARQKERIS